MSRALNLAGVFGRAGLVELLNLKPTIVNAAGSNSQANATTLTTTYTVVQSLSAVTTRGVKAFVAATGNLLIVKNAQTTNMKLYPATSSKLGTAAVNASVSVGSLKTAVYVARNRLQWDLLLTVS